MIEPGLRDRVVLVTGSNNPRGIGSAVAHAFGAEGARLLLHLYPGGRTNGKGEVDEGEGGVPVEFVVVHDGASPVGAPAVARHLVTLSCRTPRPQAGGHADLPSSA